MKKFYTLLLAAMAFAMPAQAYEVNVNFDNAEAVTVYKGDTNWYYSLDDFKQFPVVEITQGENVLDAEGYLWIVANDGYVITSKFETGQSYVETLPNGGSWSYVEQRYLSIPTRSWNITTMTSEEFNDGSFTLKCDDFSKLTFEWAENEWSGRSFQPEIPEGAEEITIPFSTTYSNMIKIQQQDYKAFYQVTVDGEPFECGNSFFTSAAELNGKTVEILCNYPEVECHVKVLFANEGTEKAVSSVSIEGEPVENVDFSDIPLMCGQSLSLNFDRGSFDIQDVTFNGEQNGNWVWGFSSQIVKDSEIVITAHEYATYTKTVSLSGAEFIKQMQIEDNEYNRTPIDYKDGEFTFEYKENATDLSIQFDTHTATLATLTNNGESLMDNYYGNEYIYLNLSEIAEGTLAIDLEKILRDKLMVVYFDADPSTYWANFQTTKDYYQFPVKEGYTLIEFSDEDGEFRASWYNIAKDNLYINDEKQPYTNYDHNYIFTPKDQDVVKIFMESDPEPVQLTFETEGEVDAEGVKDMITPVDLNSSYSVLPGTLVKVSAPEGKVVNVAVGDEAGKDAEVHEFTVNADTKVTVKPGTDSGVENVAADAVAPDAAVYNLQGVKVGTKADMQRLPKGVYVVGGVKVVK